MSQFHKIYSFMRKMEQNKYLEPRFTQSMSKLISRSKVRKAVSMADCDEDSELRITENEPVAVERLRPAARIIIKKLKREKLEPGRPMMTIDLEPRLRPRARTGMKVRKQSAHPQLPSLNSTMERSQTVKMSDFFSYLDKRAHPKSKNATWAGGRLRKRGPLGVRDTNVACYPAEGATNVMNKSMF